MRAKRRRRRQTLQQLLRSFSIKRVLKESTKTNRISSIFPTIYFVFACACERACACVRREFGSSLFVKCENWKTVYIYFYKVITSWYIPVWSQLTAKHWREQTREAALLPALKLLLLFIKHNWNNMPTKNINKSGAKKCTFLNGNTVTEFS